MMIFFSMFQGPFQGTNISHYTIISHKNQGRRDIS